MNKGWLSTAPLLLLLASCSSSSAQGDAGPGSDLAITDLTGVDLTGSGSTDLISSTDMAGCPATMPTPFTACTNTPGTLTGPTCMYPGGTCTCSDSVWTC